MIFAVFVALFVGLLVAHRFLERRIVDEVPSPSGDRVAVLHRLGEGEGASAYGFQVVVLPWWVPMKNHFGEPVFRGYCDASPTLAWTNDQLLRIRCLERTVEVAKDAIGDVRVLYE
jgi:hypothetical protein